MKRIVTHPRSAHHDDVLCLAYLMEADTVIERREPAQAELDDPEVYIVDVGMQWDAERNNYDHHQSEGVPESCCAFSLVLKSRGMYETAQECWPWLKFVELYDTGGSQKIETEYGIVQKRVPEVMDPIGAFIISLVREHSTINPGIFVHDLLLQFGKDLRNQPVRFRHEFDTMDQQAKRGIVKSQQGAPILYIDFSEILENLDLQDPWIASRHPDALCYIYNSDGNLALRRTLRAEAQGAIDFNKAAGHSAITFIHKAGFLAKLSSRDREAARTIMAEGYVE